MHLAVDAAPDNPARPMLRYAILLWVGLLYCAGFALLALVSWKLPLPVAVLLWATNIENNVIRK
jgi:hypothetical protein